PYVPASHRLRLYACAHPVPHADATRTARALSSDAEDRGGVLEPLCLAGGGKRFARSVPAPLQRSSPSLGFDPDRRRRRRHADGCLRPRSGGAAAEVAGLGEGGEEKARADDRRHALSAAGSRPDAGTGSNGLMATSESRSHQSGRTYPPLAHRATCVRGHGHRGQSVDKSSVATSHTEPNFTCPLEFGAKTLAETPNGNGRGALLRAGYTDAARVHEGACEPERRGPSYIRRHRAGKLVTIHRNERDRGDAVSAELSRDYVIGVALVFAVSLRKLAGARPNEPRWPRGPHVKHCATI